MIVLFPVHIHLLYDTKALDGQLYISLGPALFQNNIEFVSLKVIFVIHVANSTDPDGMPHIVAFHLGLHC